MFDASRLNARSDGQKRTRFGHVASESSDIKSLYFPTVRPVSGAKLVTNPWLPELQHASAPFLPPLSRRTLQRIPLAAHALGERNALRDAWRAGFECLGDEGLDARWHAARCHDCLAVRCRCGACAHARFDRRLRHIRRHVDVRESLVDWIVYVNGRLRGRRGYSRVARVGPLGECARAPDRRAVLRCARPFVCARASPSARVATQTQCAPRRGRGE